MPYKFREDELKRKREYYSENKEKIDIKHKNYYLNNRKKMDGLHLRLLRDGKSWSSIKYNYLRRFFNSDGVCLICGEINPFVLEVHHIIKGLNFTATLCANCHSLMDRFKNNKKVWEGLLSGEILSAN